MRELSFVNEEMKGVCLSVQFKAYCRVGEEGRLPSKRRRSGSTIPNPGTIIPYYK
jgi:hypothetical protein